MVREWYRKDEKAPGFRQTSRNMIFAMCALVFIVGMAGSPVWADKNDEEYRKHKDHHPNPAARLDRMSKTLSLTEAQKTKIMPILEEKAKRVRSLHDQMKALRVEMKEVWTQARGKIEAELTEEQKAKFQEMRKKHKERKKHKHNRQNKHDQHNEHDDDDD